MRIAVRNTGQESAEIDALINPQRGVFSAAMVAPDFDSIEILLEFIGEIDVSGAGDTNADSDIFGEFDRFGHFVFWRINESSDIFAGEFFVDIIGNISNKTPNDFRIISGRAAEFFAGILAAVAAAASVFGIGVVHGIDHEFIGIIPRMGP